MADQFRGFPHQFKPGDKVFLRPARHPWRMEPFVVAKRLLGPQLLWMGLRAPRMPHYLLRDPAGDEWEASQLEVTSRPVNERGQLLQTMPSDCD